MKNLKKWCNLAFLAPISLSSYKKFRADILHLARFSERRMDDEQEALQDDLHMGMTICASSQHVFCSGVGVLALMQRRHLTDLLSLHSDLNAWSEYIPRAGIREQTNYAFPSAHAFATRLGTNPANESRRQNFYEPLVVSCGPCMVCTVRRLSLHIRRISGPICVVKSEIHPG